MSLPDPKPGLVIGYEFLFREEAEAGRETGRKARPCAVVVVVGEGVNKRVWLVAATHSPPSPGAARYHLELTPEECREMGLDGAAHWVCLRDLNAFDWPGYDLRPSAPGGGFVYGRMSKGGFRRLVAALKECAARVTRGRV